MALQKVAEIPRSLARQRWAAKIRVGFDPDFLIGKALPALVVGAAAVGQNQQILSSLIEVGTVEAVDFLQSGKARERFRLGELQSFQNIPQKISSTLRLSRVVLKAMPDAERTFNFLPSNLVLQQLPFVIELVDVGGGADTRTTHYLFGCRFDESAVRYDVTSTHDTRLIQNATVTAGTVLTFDQSVAGNPVLQAVAFAAEAVLEASGLEETIEDLAI